jgi:hypothetical protein
MTKDETPREIAPKPRGYTTWELHHKMQYEDNYIDGIPDAFVFNLLHLLCKDFEIWQQKILICLKVVQLHYEHLGEEYDHENNVCKIFDDYNGVDKSLRLQWQGKTGCQLLTIPGATPDHLTLQLLQSEGVIKKLCKEIRKIYAGVKRHCHEHAIDLSLLDANTVIINRSHEKK